MVVREDREFERAQAQADVPIGFEGGLKAERISVERGRRGDVTRHEDRGTDLFGTRGFADVALDDVAHAAGVTRGAVYHHYRSKMGLFRAIAARLQAQVADAVVQAAATAGADPQQQLRAGSHAFLDAMTTGPAVRVLLVDGPAVIGWQEWRRLDAENSEVHLREALRSVGVVDGLLDALTAQLSGAMNEAALWIGQQPRRAGARAKAHAALDQLLTAVLH